MVESKLPPGFRFHPRDEELICDYLMKKVDQSADQQQYPLLIEVDLNKSEPWEIPGTFVFLIENLLIISETQIYFIHILNIKGVDFFIFYLFSIDHILLWYIIDQEFLIIIFLYDFLFVPHSWVVDEVIATGLVQSFHFFVTIFCG